MKRIPLSKRGKKNAGIYFADTREDLFEQVSQINWSVTSRGTHREVLYATGMVNGEQKYMHQFIWELLNGPIPHGQDVDHNDKNGLNNDPANLRLTSRAKNALNRRPFQTKREQSSKYKGVSRRRNKWLARLQGKHLGYYDLEEAAAHAYDRAAFALDPEFAVLNFPDEWHTSSRPNVIQAVYPMKAQLEFDL